MTHDDIIELAIEAGLYSGNPRTPGTEAMIAKRLQRFAELVAAATREECAALCDRFQARDVGMQPAECAAAIRAMNKQEQNK